MSSKYPGTTRFDASEYLETPEAIAEYRNAAIETGNPAFIADALGVIARAHDTSEIAHKTGLSRESLYCALSADGNPEYATVMKVLEALGLQFTVKKAPKSKRAA